MSPIIFLIAFIPIIQLAQSLSSPGFQFQIPINSSTDLPTLGSTLYCEWNEINSDDPPGCIVSNYNSDGEALLCYNNERVTLSSIRWTFAKSAKIYRPTDSPPTAFIPAAHKKRETITRSSAEHKVKAFADDLTLISVDKQQHSWGLREIDECCKDLDLEVRPDKCVSLLIKIRGQN